MLKKNTLWEVLRTESIRAYELNELSKKEVVVIDKLEKD